MIQSTEYEKCKNKENFRRPEFKWLSTRPCPGEHSCQPPVLVCLYVYVCIERYHHMALVEFNTDCVICRTTDLMQAEWGN